MRLAADSLGHQDLLLAVSHNEAQGLTNAILLGCTESLPVFLGSAVGFNDLKSVGTFLRFAAPSAAHPMLPFAMLADLQLKRFRERDLGMRTKVAKAIGTTQLSRRKGPGIVNPPNAASGRDEEPIDYDDVTRDILHLFTESHRLTQAMTEFLRNLDKFATSLSVVDDSLPAQRQQYLQTHGKRIKSQTDEIRDEINALIDKSRSTTEQASILMSSVRLGFPPSRSWPYVDKRYRCGI